MMTRVVVVRGPGAVGSASPISIWRTELSWLWKRTPRRGQSGSGWSAGRPGLATKTQTPVLLVGVGALDATLH